MKIFGPKNFPIYVNPCMYIIGSTNTVSVILLLNDQQLTHTHATERIMGNKHYY